MSSTRPTAALAFGMWQRDGKTGTEVTWEDAEELLAGPPFRRRGPKTVLRVAVNENVLVSDSDRTKVRFCHPVFQDYYVAREIAARFNNSLPLKVVLASGERDVRELLPDVSDAILFAAAFVNNGEAFVDQLQQLDPVLACQCQEEIGISPKAAVTHANIALLRERADTFAREARTSLPTYQRRHRLRVVRQLLARRDDLAGHISLLGEDDGWEEAAEWLLRQGEVAVLYLEDAARSGNWKVCKRVESILQAARGVAAPQTEADAPDGGEKP